MNAYCQTHSKDVLYFIEFPPQRFLYISLWIFEKWNIYAYKQRLIDNLILNIPHFYGHPLSCHEV